MAAAASTLVVVLSIVQTEIFPPCRSPFARTACPAASRKALVAVEMKVVLHLAATTPLAFLLLSDVP